MIVTRPRVTDCASYSRNAIGTVARREADAGVPLALRQSLRVSIPRPSEIEFTVCRCLAIGSITGISNAGAGVDSRRAFLLRIVRFCG